MDVPFKRLQEARAKAGFSGPTEAARAFGWGISTYLSHENGTRGLRPAVADRYAKAFRVPAEWLLYARWRNKLIVKGNLPPRPNR